MSGVVRTKAIPAQPAAADGDASGRGGLPNDAVQIVAYDPSGVVSPADHERAWGIRNLTDYLGGGAISFKSRAFTFADAALVEHVIYTPATFGDIILPALCWVEVHTAFDCPNLAATGANQLNVLVHGADPDSGAMFQVDLQSEDADQNGYKVVGTSPTWSQGGKMDKAGAFVKLDESDPLVFVLDDQAGVDPESTVGAGVLYIAVFTP